MLIHKEGYKILLGLLVALFIINITANQLMPGNPAMMEYLKILSILSFFTVALFFRRPFRMTEIQEDYVLAPADGKVVAIEEVEEPEYFKDRRLLVSIFMSPSNIHVNWNPISGFVKYIKYHPGKYLVAWNPKSSQNNERNSVVIEDDGVEILVRQIAGVMARRIVHYLEEGEKVIQGKELGFIKFGSRVDMYLPLDASIEVVLKQKVKGGKTVISRLNRD